jgi:putative oxidoreductase
MFGVLRRFEPYAYLVLRIAAGFMFVFHGLQKLLGMFGGQEVQLLSRLGAAGVIETVGGAMIAVGGWTVPVALLASGEMAFAYYLGHHPRGGWPIQNSGELALLYCAAFFYIATRGPGMLSLDALMARGKRSW